MPVLLIGDGPAVDAAELMLEDSDVAVTRGSLADLPGADLAIVVGLAGSDGFETANTQAMESETPWIAVEIGGVGGIPLESVSATVTTFQPGYVCFDCLKSRVAVAGLEAAEEATADRPAAHLAGSYAALQAIRAFSGAEVAGVLIEVPYGERSVLPVPHCEHAPERDRTLDLDDVDRSLEQAINQAEIAIDDRVGIVPQIGEHDSFPLPYYLARVTNASGWSDGNPPDRAAGVAPTWDQAFMKALGEALERYSGAMYRTDELQHRPIADLTDPAPQSFASVTRDQIESIEGTVPTVEGRDLHASTSTVLPADLVFYPPPEGRLGQSITTGLGLGNDGVEAVLSGLYETIERDATMLAWYSTFEPLGLEVTDPTITEMIERARGSGLSVTPLLMTQDVDVPVVGVAVHREEYPKFAMGSAAALDGEAAVRDALSEALQNWMELRELGPDKAVESGGEIGRYAQDPGPAETLLDPGETVPAAAVGPESVPDGVNELDAVLERMDAAGLDAYAASVTPRDVEQLGFTAVRVLSPSAQPLFVDEPIFGDRAHEAPEELGFEPRLDRDFHPYP